MPVQTIECQLTQAQVKRYLAGADFPEEIVTAIERHLKACPDCMAEANRQREALGGAPAEISQAVVSTAKKSPLASVTALLKRKKSAPTPPQGLIAERGKNPYPTDAVSLIKTPKNLILSASLAVILVLMSTVMRNPTMVFGPKAAAKIDAPTDSTKDAKSTSDATDETKTHEESADKTESSETAIGASDAPKETHDTHASDKSESEPDAAKSGDESAADSTESTPVDGANPRAEAATKAHVKSEPKAKTPATAHDSSGEAAKLGGGVVVAEAAPKVTKPVTKPTPIAAKVARRKSVTRNRPAIKQVRATAKPKPKAKAKAKPKSHAKIRVYEPDGSIKKN